MSLAPQLFHIFLASSHNALRNFFLMFYPFPRSARRPPPSPHSLELSCAATSMSVAQTLWYESVQRLQPASIAVSDFNNEAAGVALDDKLVALLARSQMKRRHPKARAGTLSSRARAAGHGQLFALPAREEEASRIAQMERRRERELKAVLYGEHAGEVRALEARLNAPFDRAMRTDAPPMWPSVPLMRCE